MDSTITSPITYVIPIEEAHEHPVRAVGGKSRNTSICSREGFRVPEGFAITADTYFQFVRENRIDKIIGMELARKQDQDMRWEEVWDSALRIRLAFTRGVMNPEMEASLLEALSRWPEGSLFAVRSSSPEEDSKEFSFAGVHESYVDVSGSRQVLEKIKLVWASLWSDRALLYKKESGLDPYKSSMAVLVQKMEHRDISGLAFTADPSNRDREHMVVEAIRGSLHLLVDNKKEPERIRISKATGEYTEVGKPLSGKTLTRESIRPLYENALKLENLYQEPVDIEWTGLLEEFTVLQVRPITVFKKDENQERQWYLTLTPSGEQLLDLAEKVEKILIPELIAEGQELALLGPEKLEQEEFLQEFKRRGESHDKWEQVYREDFIPFAHGIRHFGSFYNDLMKPADPYEFTHLLKNQDMMAQKRNRSMQALGEQLRTQPEAKKNMLRWMEEGLEGNALLVKLEESSSSFPDGQAFAKDFLEFLNRDMDVAYDQTSLKDAPEASLQVILALAEENASQSDQLLSPQPYFLQPQPAEIRKAESDGLANALADSFFQRATEESLEEEAENWLRIGRVSWKLRDDDNILLGKIESQLHAFVMEGLAILYQEKLIERIPEKYDVAGWKTVYQGVMDNESIELAGETVKPADRGAVSGKARQMVGQPSSPGIYTGVARVIRSIQDFKGVSKGEVLVFDAVEPQMTFIISLAGAIVERRGGMLVHSSIIAREMNIPAVNGVPKATDFIQTGDLVTVNGDLGIVVIGKPEFELELGGL